MQRARKHLATTERKESDFVQARVSEESVYGRQVKSHERASGYLSSKVDSMDA
jgi:hypothetical protein